MMQKLLIAAACGLSLSAASIRANEILVGQGESIASAVALASPGDTILIDGDHSESVILDSRTDLHFVIEGFWHASPWNVAAGPFPRDRQEDGFPALYLKNSTRIIVTGPGYIEGGGGFSYTSPTCPPRDGGDGGAALHLDNSTLLLKGDVVLLGLSGSPTQGSCCEAQQPVLCGDPGVTGVGIRANQSTIEAADVILVGSTLVASTYKTSRELADFDQNGCTDLPDFLTLLDNWQLVYQGATLELADFLNLLDNWQSGIICN